MPAGVAERLDALAAPPVPAAAVLSVAAPSVAPMGSPLDAHVAAPPLPIEARTDRAAGDTTPAPEMAVSGAGKAEKPANPADSQPALLAVGSPGSSEINAAIRQSRSAFIGIGILSCLINLLMLTGPLFMLQVYDRVMTSGSMPTLVALSALTVILFAMSGFFDVVRTRIVARVGVEIDQRLSDRIFRASLKRSIRQQGASVTALRDLDAVRQFASGPAPTTFFDAPWTPIYLLVIFLVHWALGLAALVGAGLIVAIAIASERAAREPLAEANIAAAKSLEMADSAQRNAEALAAMGMVEAFRRRWQAASSNALAWQILASDRLGTASSLSKSIRLLLQSMMLAVGAALAISGDISAGSIIAGTIIFGRAMAPVEQAVVHWKSFVKAREAFEKLAKLLRDVPELPVRTELPPPKGHLTVSQLRVAAPDSGKLILANLGFEVKPGEVCAVIGPSASGKSTLARALVGLWPPAGGKIAVDGADLKQWNPEALGQYIGYLPQDVELFAGTVRDNICRFRKDATDGLIVDAAKMAHAHELIVGLPQGYDTQLGAFGTYLSAGQRQRIGLARALFGNPALVVLDEPNANLDRLGDEALTAALAGTKARGQAVVLISHRVQAIGIADKLLFIDRGVQRAFGPQAEVMKLFRQSGGAVDGGPPPRTAQSTGPQQQAQSIKVVTQRTAAASGAPTETRVAGKP